jgi:hypothetical protein
VLTLDGSSGGASTTGPVLNTAGSYSVSAWAKLSNTNANAVIISQEDTTNSSFALRYDKTLNAWTFAVSTTATGTARRPCTPAPRPPSTLGHTWSAPTTRPATP